jgi:hypothetical protein
MSTSFRDALTQAAHESIDGPNVPASHISSAILIGGAVGH